MLYAQLKKWALTSQATLGFFLIALFTSQIVFSGTYTGVILDKAITSDSVKVTIQTEGNKQTLVLSVETTSHKKLLSRLKIGDYLAFQAQNTPKKNSFKLQSIDYVGLKDVLGIWTGDDGFCYNFTYFSKLEVYEKIESEPCTRGELSDYIIFPKVFKYFITPNETDWDVLVGDQDMHFSAEFSVISTQHIFAQIYDTETGKIESELNLWR